ncbi:ribosome biogenesis GTP-binding protein YihA/YsxC [Clostridium sp. CX1]|uniref:Probable GTP-binding protein EngB n=1 Tax=Clostridium tanneri TaxID=3037988 RepID=A0ABU4JTD0_9CLOT|nr:MULTISPECIES: ribosome biogenesis GTP-binding protein YihA/YsxC [unclassified Clostridium]MCT8978192.1 ribosome biogenesis GTP-binding protein YihA/YsxC [Clostridium sp. CX1]MDW8801194.1 ribosome biogenesis GTP-binding protein YihA/YsxC [Clostridium sp. A1-XYC3]
MEIKQAEFITSAVVRTQYPEDGRAEIAFVGRSNVGKSSLINTLTNRRKLVKVSGTPGKTRLVNFFLINNEFYFVDLPGYGYAKVSKTEKESWGKVIETYLVQREQLKKIVLLVDCRHKPSADDITMYKWIKYYNYDTIVVATKIDKLTRTELQKNLRLIKDTLELKDNDQLLTFSSLKKQGKEELLEVIQETLDKSAR